mgnify:FL=1
MIVKKSVQLWDHVPSLHELQEKASPATDSTIEQFKDGTNLDVYLKYTGLRFYTNGRAFKKDETNIKSEMKYCITDDVPFFPEYEIPDKQHFILI